MRQKPIAVVGVAWCPGGRTAQNAASPSPAVERLDRGRARASGEHAPRRSDASLIAVSASSHPPPDVVGAGQERQEGRLVHALELLGRRRARGDRHQRVGHPRRRDPGEDRLEPGGPLGMATAGLVVEVPRMGDEQDGHGDATVSATRPGAGDAYRCGVHAPGPVDRR